MEIVGQDLLVFIMSGECDFNACFPMGWFTLSTLSTPLFWVGAKTLALGYSIYSLIFARCSVCMPFPSSEEID